MSITDTVVKKPQDDLVVRVTNEFLSSGSILDDGLYTLVSDALKCRGYEKFSVGSNASVFLKPTSEGTKALLLAQGEDRPIRYALLRPLEERNFVRDCRKMLKGQGDIAEDAPNPAKAFINCGAAGFIISLASGCDPIQIVFTTTGIGAIGAGVAYMIGHKSASKINLDEKYSIQRYGASALQQI